MPAKAKSHHARPASSYRAARRNARRCRRGDGLRAARNALGLTRKQYDRLRAKIANQAELNSKGTDT